MVSPKDHQWNQIYALFCLSSRVRKQIDQRDSIIFNSTDADYFLCFCEKLQNKQIKELYLSCCMYMIMSMQ